jgi:hypothetical protein
MVSESALDNDGWRVHRHGQLNFFIDNQDRPRLHGIGPCVGFYCEGEIKVAIKTVRTIINEKQGRAGVRLAPPQQLNEENRYPGMELDAMMEYPGGARQRSYDSSSFGADEWMKSGTPGAGPAQWPEWKQEDDRAYQQYLDVAFKGDVD